MFPAVKTSERFACERKVFEYEYISILNVCVLKHGKCEQSVWDIYVLSVRATTRTGDIVSCNLIGSDAEPKHWLDRERTKFQINFLGRNTECL